MSELRKDPVTGRWVIIAPERARRASDLRSAPPPSVETSLCPLCPGQETLTPPEIYAIRRQAGAVRDGPGWSLRVVPNKLPALRVEGELAREGDGLFDKMQGVGAHEVIIETADHAKGFGHLSTAELEEVLWSWRERMRDLSQDQRLRSIVVFKNHGAEAGATLAHPHSQLVALPIVPLAIAEELEGARAHWDLKERCIWCDVVQQERKDRTRLVQENDDAVALAPWAARAPFETWVLPRRHRAHFEEESRDVLRGVADVVRSTMRRLDVALDSPAYNLMLHSAPLRERGLAHYHWHIEIVPAVSRFAGFEWGSGFQINPVAPEEAAAFLRKTPS
jgi:UDPglucose--hexose-1-phosphate uridylyltransferase